MSGFRHRPNNDGSIDSICLRCFRTVASNNYEWSLAMVESHHQCNPVDLMRFEHLQIEKETQTEFDSAA